MSHSDETVLLLEDEALMRWTASRALRRAGYRVLEAVTVEEALKLAAECPPGRTLFVLDALLPGVMGTEAAQALKQVHPSAHVLFLSAYSMDVLDSEQLEQSGDSILSRTVTMEALIRRVRQILNGSLVPQP